MVTRTIDKRPRTRPIGLAGLRGFEASARYLSFTAAAAELSLTQSSISRQVASLEHELGCPLFVRRTRALELTAAGDRLFRLIHQSLDALDRTVGELRGNGAPPRVALTTYPSFASLWLGPRLADFQRIYPEVEIRIDAADRMVDLEAEQVDLAIRRRKLQDIHRDSVLLHTEEAVPALSSRLLERTGVSLESPADLFKLPMLEVDDGLAISAASGWARWLKYAGTPSGRPPNRLLFTYVDQSMQAAVRGQGVVIARSPFVDDLVASGDLVLPFPKLRMRTGYEYFLVENRDRSDLPQVAALRAWLVEEFRQGPRRSS